MNYNEKMNYASLNDGLKLRKLRLPKPLVEAVETIAVSVTGREQLLSVLSGILGVLFVALFIPLEQRPYFTIGGVSALSLLIWLIGVARQMKHLKASKALLSQLAHALLWRESETERELRSFARLSLGRQEEIVSARLMELAKILRNHERNHVDPQHPQRVEVKAEFDASYKAFLDAGLIFDTGYGVYFKKEVAQVT